MAVATTFLITPIGVGVSRKDHELHVAKIRSHAAKVTSHRRRILRDALAKSTSATRHAIEESPDGRDTNRAVLRDSDQKTQPPPTIWSWTNAIRTDPFNCLEEGSLVDGRHAIDFLVTFVAPLTASISDPFGMSNIYGRWMLEHVAQYPDVMHAVAAGMLLLAGAPIGNPPPQNLPYGEQKAVLLHKYAATSRLRARLALPNATADDSAILTILFLALVEDATGNCAAFRMHLSRVAAMVDIRGGIKRLKTTSWIKAAISQALVANSLLQGYDGYIDDADDQELDSPSSCSPVAVEELPVGFEALARTGALSLRLSRLIARIATTPVNASRRSSLDTVFASDQPHFRGFLSSDLPLNSPDGPDGPPLEKAICLALIRYLHLDAVGRGHKLCLYHSFSLMLTKAMQTMKVPVKRTERRCFIWVWLVAVGSWSIGDGYLGSEGVELLQKLREACPELDFTSSKDVEELGKQFFWSPVLSKLVKRNWEKTGDGNA